MEKLHETERRRAAERQAKAAAALSTVGISKRPMGGGRGGGAGRGKGCVLPKRLKSGSGHHRVEIYGPPSDRHKLSRCRPDSFASWGSLPSAIDALDPLYEPYAV